MTKDIDITSDQLGIVRELDDFDLRMLLSEINDHGWENAERTLHLIAVCRVIDKIESAA